MKVEVTPEARRQLEERAAWWEENRPDSRVDVNEAFVDAIATIRSFPHLGRRYPQRPNYRVLQMTGTPYWVFYRVERARRVVFVVAVWGQSQGEVPPI